jgi:hypothetical protein
MTMVDRNVRGLCWSIAAYYLVVMLALSIIYSPPGAGGSVGEVLSAAAGMPILFVLLFLGSFSVVNFWIALGVVTSILAGLTAAIVRLRGKWRIAAVLTLLTAMNLYAAYIGARVGA